MSSLGEQLRLVREEKGISLEHAADTLKISKRYLSALEEDSFNVLPAEIYVKGFLSNYAKFLGLDPQTIVDQYNRLMLPKNEIFNSVTRLKKRTTRQVKRSRIFTLLLIVVIAIICLVILYIFRNSV